MKTLRFLFWAFLLVAGFTACSNDIDNNTDKEEPWSSDDDVLVDFSLLNDKGEKCSSFKENEVIFFDLVITNKRIGSLSILDGFKEGSDIFFDKDFFCVYTAKGEKINVPWTGMFCEYALHKALTIEAGTTYHVSCPWRYETSDNLGEFVVSYPLCKGFDNENSLFPALKKGDYYTEFVVKYKNLTTSKTFIEKKFKYKFKID